MPTKFDDYIREIEEGKAEGPKAVARWNAFNAVFAMAREVRELRKERHLTQKQLAAASDIIQAEISHIDRGQTNPTASTLAALLAPLGACLGVVKREGRDESCASSAIKRPSAEPVPPGSPRLIDEPPPPPTGLQT